MTAKERVVLILGAGGYASQIVWQYLGGEPSPLIVGASLALLGVVAPFIRLYETRRGNGGGSNGGGGGRP